MNITRSASCSICPLSRRSDSSGRLSCRALLGRAAELGDGDHRHLQLAREDLQPAADLAHLLDAAVADAVRPHQLEVVDDDQAEAAAALLLRVQAARLRAQLEDVDVGGVVDPERRLARAPRTPSRPSASRSARPGPCAACRPGMRAWLAMKRCASSVSDISSENSATGRPCLTATFSAMLATSALLPIEGRAASTIRFDFWKPPVMSSRSREARRRAGQRLPVARELLELVDLLVQDLLDRAEVAATLGVRDLEQPCARRPRPAACGSPLRSATSAWIFCENFEQAAQRSPAP